MRIRSFAILFFFMLGLLGPGFAQASLEKGLSRRDLLRELNLWGDEVRAGQVAVGQELEKDLRLEWIYRIKFAVATQYEETEASLVQILKNIKDIEETPQNRRVSRLAPFLSSLLEAIDLDLEKRESTFALIREYTESGGILAPLTAEQFADRRQYRSPGLSEAAFFSRTTSTPEMLDSIALESTDGLSESGERSTDSFEIDPLAQSLDAEFASKSTVFDPAKGNLGIRSHEIIQSHKSNIEPLRYSMKPLLIL